ncbi:phosphoribosylformylglycinamidine synthase subunit PurL [soil metagenome]
MSEGSNVEETYAALGISESEYERIVGLLGREPNFLELSLFSVMWSEHCGYKNSRPLLGRFPNEGKRVVQGPGENAGAIDIGEGWAVAFKMESHNHPSAVEPYEGAATGVGGIIRDILAMGARPVALMNSLRFGEPSEGRTDYLFREVVRGIGGYGNAVGVPTVGGEIEFAQAYSGNPLVNAMCVGLVRSDRIVSAEAKGVGNVVILLGSKTGRDGIHGATFASGELSEESESKRSNVQVGDPFAEKMLIECCLELLDQEMLVALQDLGAAGITSSASEMAERGGVGIEIEAEKVPRREEGMEAWEVMISESQERMLAVVEPARADEVIRLAERYELLATTIGRVTDDGELRVLDEGIERGSVPAEALADAPAYEREIVRPAYLDRVQKLDIEEIPQPEDYNAALLTMLAHPNLCSRRSVWEQYDHQVGTDTVVLPGADAAVMRVKDTKGGTRGFAVTTDGRGRLCYLDPHRGGAVAVAEAYRNLSAVGAEPAAVTDCLNFGSPEKPEGYYQLAGCIEGISEACEALETPVVSGNVSLYNETAMGEIYPTPVIGMVGVMDDVRRHATPAFKREGDAVYVVGDFRPSINASEYLEILHGKAAGEVSEPDLSSEKRASDAVRQAVASGMLDTAHDVSGGGLTVALAGMALAGGLGVEISLLPGARMDVALFGECGGCFVVAVPEQRAGEFERAVEGVGCSRVGTTGGEKLSVAGLVDVPVSELAEAHVRDLFSGSA